MIPDMNASEVEGVKVLIPKGRRLTLRRQLTLASCIKQIQDTFEQELTTVILNSNFQGEGYYNVVFRFKTNNGGKHNE